MSSDSMDDITVETSERDDVLVVTVRGDAGARQAERLDAAISRIRTDRAINATLDLAGVTFISSLGLAALMSFRSRVASAGGKLKIGPVSFPVLSVLRHARLTDVLEFTDAPPGMR